MGEAHPEIHQKLRHLEVAQHHIDALRARGIDLPSLWGWVRRYGPGVVQVIDEVVAKLDADQQ